MPSPDEDQQSFMLGIVSLIGGIIFNGKYLQRRELIRKTYNIQGICPSSHYVKSRGIHDGDPCIVAFHVCVSHYYRTVAGARQGLRHCGPVGAAADSLVFCRVKLAHILEQTADS